jgi:hypothetical protein
MATPLIPTRFGFSFFVVAPLASSFGLHDDLPLFDQVRVLIIQATRHGEVRELGRFTEDVESETFWDPFDLLIEGPVED